MENFIKKIINNEQVNLSEINTFIVDYCKLMENKIPTQEELTGIVTAIQMGIFNLITAVKYAAIKLNIQINTLYDKQGQMIKMFIA